MSHEEIELSLDENNEIIFDLTIEGNFKKVENPEFRLFCEGKDFSIKFNGEKTKDGVKFIISQLKNIIPPGKHNLVFEVIADNKHFVPMKLEANFVQENLSIKSESVSINSKKEQLKPSGLNIKSASVKKINSETPNAKVKFTGKELKSFINEMIKKNNL